jgi:hypothetical protein
VGEASKDCASAFKKKVVVQAGETTEVVLINQCKGMDKGAVDVISALNHPPELVRAAFHESKFTCGSPATFCAKVRDIDGDPLDIELKLLSGKCEVKAVGNPDGMPMTGVVQCFTVDCTEVGRADLRLRGYDQLWVEGAKQRIEDWLTDQGYPHPSHTELNLPAYFDGTKVYPDADGDGHGDASAPAKLICGDDVPAGYVTSNDDCDDAHASAHPGGTETCPNDGLDNDCNGTIDDGNCGQCKVGGTCGTYDIGGCNCGPVSACAKTAEGDPQCVQNWSCAASTDCTTSADCAAGSRCIIDSCCGVPKCAPHVCLEPVIPLDYSPADGSGGTALVP